MPFTLSMPKLSPTMEEGVITKWHKKVGEYVEADSLLIEVATDKATVEYQALDSGWLRQITVEEGSAAQINQIIAVFTQAKDEPFEMHVEKVSSVEVSISKENVETSTHHVTENTKVSSAAPGMSQPAFTPEEPLKGYSFYSPNRKEEEKVFASPLARKLAQEKNLDLYSVKGTGPAGRIMSHDLEKALPKQKIPFSRQKFPESIPGSYQEIPLTPMRKAIGRRLQESKTFIPHFYVSQNIDVERLSDLREQLKNMDVKLTVNDFIIRACALALREFPSVNSGFNSVNQTIIQFETVDISVAVSIDGGLITPIIRHADWKNVGEISTEVKLLAKRAKEGKLAPEEYKGGSFTISNLGMFGVNEFQAIINPPQAAILAIAGTQEVAMVKNGQLVSGQQMKITLSVDHRVIDGAIAAQFLNAVKKYLENPAILLLG